MSERANSILSVVLFWIKLNEKKYQEVNILAFTKSGLRYAFFFSRKTYPKWIFPLNCLLKKPTYTRWKQVMSSDGFLYFLHPHNEHCDVFCRQPWTTKNNSQKK